MKHWKKPVSGKCIFYDKRVGKGERAQTSSTNLTAFEGINIGAAVGSAGRISHGRTLCSVMAAG